MSFRYTRMQMWARWAFVGWLNFGIFAGYALWRDLDVLGYIAALASAGFGAHTLTAAAGMWLYRNDVVCPAEPPESREEA